VSKDGRLLLIKVHADPYGYVDIENVFRVEVETPAPINQASEAHMSIIPLVWDNEDLEEFGYWSWREVAMLVNKKGWSFVWIDEEYDNESYVA